MSVTKAEYREYWILAPRHRELDGAEAERYAVLCAKIDAKRRPAPHANGNGHAPATLALPLPTDEHMAPAEAPAPPEVADNGQTAADETPDALALCSRADDAPAAPSAYHAFLVAKSQLTGDGGFAPTFLPPWMFDFQAHLTDWALRRGRAAVLAECGLGKTCVTLVWCENVMRKLNRPVLILTPLCVAHQFVDEGQKFGIGVTLNRTGRKPTAAEIHVTNYEQLHRFDPADWGAAAGDEAGVLKHMEGVRRNQIVQFLRCMEYRLLATATPAPNDFIELGNHSEALGELGYQDMLSRFFKNDKRGVSANSVMGAGEWRFRGHAEQHFWRWVCSWARACRKPSDLDPAFSDERFNLPPLVMEEHIVPARMAPPGRLFDSLALTQAEQCEERRRTIPERCEKAAETLASAEGPVIGWVNLNPEGDLLTRLIPGAAQISGADPDERKEELLHAFIRGELRALISKSTICGFGLNLQHCADMSFFAGHSFEQMYQAIRRCHRFGQERTVRVRLVTSEGALAVRNNLQRKARQAEEMFSRLVEHMQDSLAIERSNPYTKATETPSWL